MNDPTASSGHDSHLASAPPPHNSRRQLSVYRVFNRRASAEPPPGGQGGGGEGMSGGRLFSFASGTSRKSSHEPKRAKYATEEERLGLVKDHSKEKNRPQLLQSLQSAVSLDEKADLKISYKRARSSSPSSVCSSEHKPTTHYASSREHLPPYDDDDPPSADRGNSQTVPLSTPSRSLTATPIAIRDAPSRPPLLPLPRPLPAIPTEPDLRSLDATADRPTIRWYPSPSPPSLPPPSPQHRPP